MNKTHITLVAVAALAAVMLASPAQAHALPLVRNPCAGVQTTEPELAQLFHECEVAFADVDGKVAAAIAEAIELLGPVCYGTAPTPVVTFAAECFRWANDTIGDVPDLGELRARVDAIVVWALTYGEAVDVWFAGEGDKIDAYRGDLVTWALALTGWSGELNGWFIAEATELSGDAIDLAAYALCPVTGPAPCVNPGVPGTPSTPPLPDEPPQPEQPEDVPQPDTSTFPYPV